MGGRRRLKTHLVGKRVRNVVESSEDEEEPSLPIGEGLDELLPLPELVLDSGLVGSDSLDGTRQVESGESAWMLGS